MPHSAPTPASSDPFDTLGLSPRFDLTPADVRAAYLARVAAIHPDTHADPDDAATAHLNAAKSALADPETRANLLLHKMGGPGKDVNRELPDGFLMLMMETREQVEAAAAARDQAALEHWRGWAAAQRDGHIKQTAAFFAEAGALPLHDARTGKTLSNIRRELNAWRYIERMIEQIAEL